MTRSELRWLLLSTAGSALLALVGFGIAWAVRTLTETGLLWLLDHKDAAAGFVLQGIAAAAAVSLVLGLNASRKLQRWERRRG